MGALVRGLLVLFDPSDPLRAPRPDADAGGGLDDNGRDWLPSPRSSMFLS